ncbi:MAG: alpha/beta hydrolase family esterase [Gammaproteobacteria bacterium]
MKKALRFSLYVLGTLVIFVGAFVGYFIYTPSPEVPQLSGTLTKGSLEWGRLKRTYRSYVPRGLPKGAPLVVVLHGSDQNGAEARVWTGYGFDRQADAHGFAVVYPDGYQGNWDACNIVGDYSANKLHIDDVGFLTALADKLIGELGLDPKRVFATGVSRGGHMAYRLALEAPGRFRAVAAVSANVPIPENFKCKPAAQGSASVMIMDGTADPLNTFEGGEVKFFGMYARGKVLSARESGRYFADLDHLSGAPETSVAPAMDGFQVERMLWHDGSRTEVELVAIHGGGHGMPQPYWRNPRLLGPTASLDGPAMIWAFFAQQQD